MMTDDDDFNFDDLVAPIGDDLPGDNRRGGTAAPQMWIGAVCLNFVEQEILELEYTQPLLQSAVGFTDADDSEEVFDEPSPLSTPEQDKTRKALAASYAEHRAIARSLGSGLKVTWATYEALCRAEGLTPLKRQNRTIGG